MKFAAFLCLSVAVVALPGGIARAETSDSAVVLTKPTSATAPLAIDAVSSQPTAPSTASTDVIPQTTSDAPAVSSAPVNELPPINANAAPVDAGAEIVVMGRVPPPPQDPLQALNMQSFELVQAVDVAVIGPVASGYEKTIPEPVRNGLRNFLLNLHEPGNFLNFLLQFKIGKAVETLGRFVINSTIGAAGLFDMAKRRPFNLRYRPNGFANTFGFYGVKTGPFLFLPIIGPTTARDLVGYFLDRLLLPTLVGKPFTQLAYNLPTGVLTAITRRNENKQSIEKLREGAANPYTTLREDYLKARQNDIDELRGRLTLPKTPPRPSSISDR